MEPGSSGSVQTADSRDSRMSCGVFNLDYNGALFCATKAWALSTCCRAEPSGAIDIMRDRNLQLDLLRCAAILGVLVAHTTIFRRPKWWWEQLARFPNWTGVDLFFVVSGFLISSLLFSEFQRRGRINFGRFAIRRALKLYPMLYILVFGVMLERLIHSGFHDLGWIITPALHDIFFLQSYLPGTYGHFWSLAVEEHFYILLPLSCSISCFERRAPTKPIRFEGCPLSSC